MIKHARVMLNESTVHAAVSSLQIYTVIAFVRNIVIISS